VLPVTIPLGIAILLNYDQLLAAMALVGIGLAYDDRMSDLEDAIVVAASAEERGPEDRPWSLTRLLTRAARW
jgi:hypothetical protein